jgi:hypothetical protein
LNSFGQVVGQRQLVLIEGTQQITLPFDTFAAGMYYLALQTPKGTLPAMRVVR